jgi:3'-phosphoadenosine 5'-phosphosulfate sulfotransferase (PAPS reductase)/FAD synthetase
MLVAGTKHVVGFSGGIDSQACAGWVLERFPKEDVILLNSDAGGNEHPITTEFVAWYSSHVHPVVTVTPMVCDLGGVGTVEGFGAKERRDTLDPNGPMDFATLAYVKGTFPSRKAQFCTEYLKLAPQKRWLDENLTAHGFDFIRYTGVRRDESVRRRDAPESSWDSYYDCELVQPLVAWTKAECFAFAKARGEQINPLYMMGFGRVGCAPCINSGKADIREWAARFPEMIDKVREWERRVGRTFFPPIVTGKKGRSRTDPTAINWIDEVVEWSRTERGGKQISLPFVEADAAAGACSSKYGLCE